VLDLVFVGYESASVTSVIVVTLPIFASDEFTLSQLTVAL